MASGWAHVLHALYKPWRNTRGGDLGRWSYAHTLQHGSLFVTSFVFLMGLLFKVEGVADGGGTYDGLAWIMLLLCCGFIVFAAGVLVVATVGKVRASRVKAAVSGGEVVQADRQRDRRSRASSMVGERVWQSNPAFNPTADRQLKAARLVRKPPVVAN